MSDNLGFPASDLHDAVSAGFVKAVRHDTLPLTLYSYTDRAVYEKAWNLAILAARGLILADDGGVVARPFAKFFNHGESGATVDLDTPIRTYDKVDGSLGILWFHDGEPFISTRGSFNSDQALWATEFYRTHHHGYWGPDPDYTYLFEIIYPENRIVLDYGDREDLVLLAAVNKATGRSIGAAEASTVTCWQAAIAPEFGHQTLREAILAPPRENAEGFVLWDPATDNRVKVKQEDYLLLHKFLTGTTDKHVWDVLASGADPDEHFALAPDEFHDWLRGVRTDLESRFAAEKGSVEAEFTSIRAALPEGFERKDFAAAAQGSPNMGLLFALLDGKSIDDRIWTRVKPEAGGVTLRG